MHDVRISKVQLQPRHLQVQGIQARLELPSLPCLEKGIPKQAMMNTVSQANNLSPFASRIPVELLSTIFVLCAEDYKILCVGMPPWTLARVCRRWRAVAFNTHQLWTTIKCDFHEPPQFPSPISASELEASEFEAVIALLNMVFGLIKERSLDIYFTYNGPDISRFLPSHGLQKLADFVSTRSEQWRSLTLSTPTPLVLRPHATLPSLQKLDICCCMTNQGDPAVASFIQAIQSAPKLNTLVLRTEDSFHPELPYAQLIYLEFSKGSSFSPREMVDILSRCERLETLIVSSYLSSEEAEPALLEGAGTLVMPYLRELQLSCQREHQDLCDWLTLPCLKVLTIDAMTLFNHIHRVTRLVERSQCSLDMVTFREVEFTDVSIEQLLRCAPSVRTLVLEGVIFPHLFDRMAFNDLAPKLEHLVVRAPRGPPSSFIISPPLEAVFNAAKVKTSLKSLEIEVLSEAPDIVFASKIEGLKAEGVAVWVKKSNFKNSVGRKLAVSKLRWLQANMIWHLRTVRVEKTWRTIDENMPVFDGILSSMEDNRDGYTIAELHESGFVDALEELGRAIQSRNLILPGEDVYRFGDRIESFHQHCIDSRQH
ncbi:hypothetical protein Moror_15197 [Moniliophthora roreri MCA 2997]|uniref:F-box domain-containing protein n=2 Tax=Moniliophthora roreri TaxID=221103 RepID=V2WIT8_MONRO|nr:hypothetical protein Moror_15197 [Moniliophthora roreri MCA 2997]